MDMYRRDWTVRTDTCDECEKKVRCRFISHWEKAPLSRIVIATHHEYDQFYEQSDIRKWFKYGYGKKGDAVPRHFFIVAGDFVLSKCYQPMALDEDDIKTFSGKFTELLSTYDDARQATRKIQMVLEQIKQCDSRVTKIV